MSDRTLLDEDPALRQQLRVAEDRLEEEGLIDIYDETTTSRWEGRKTARIHAWLALTMGQARWLRNQLTEILQADDNEGR